MARAAGSTANASLMKGSSDRATASLPPFHSALLDRRVLRLDLAVDLLRLFYRIPGSGHAAAQRGLRGDEGAQLVFPLLLVLHQLGVEQGLQLADQRLVAVLDAEQVVFSDARRFGPELAVLLEDAALLGEAQQPADQTHVAEGFQLRHRQLSLGRARMTADYDHLARLGARLAEREEILQPRRSAVFVDAQQRDVEVVAREVEVVRVAAAKRDRQLRGEGEAHVLETAIAVQMVETAVIEIDHVAARGFPIRADAGRGQFRLDGV